MAKVIVRDLNAGPTPANQNGHANSKTKSRRVVATKRVQTDDGRVTQIFSLDAESETFGSDLRYTFGRNVAKARRENKMKFGAPDRVLRKD